MNFVNNMQNILLDREIVANIRMATKKEIRWRLFFTSFTILFFELLCIRWLPAYVRFLSYFTNVIVLASFLGIGLGILISRREKLVLPKFSAWLFVIVGVTIL